MNIDLEHPEYVASRAMRRKYRDLYVGGEQLRANAQEYLIRRQKEASDVYAERLARVFCENYAGSIIDWYAATVFRREPTLSFDSDDSRARQFFGEFAEDCDLKSSSLTTFFRQRFIEALVQGTSYTLIDFPRATSQAGTLAEEEATGRSRAYLVGFSAENLINWECDEHGHYEWVVLRQSQLRRNESRDEWQRETRWTRYDRENYAVYRRLESGAGGSFPTDGSTPGGVELVDQGTHALAAQRQVPLIEMQVSEGLWLMNKAGLLQLEHFNRSNALSWAMTMGLFALPVVYSERPWSQVVGESYYIQLGPQDRFGWAEPEGHVYQVAADNLVRLQEEIYRVCYVFSQAASPNGQPQSAASKQRDFAATQEVLRAYGDLIKDNIKRVLRVVAGARGDEVAVDVSGLDDFDINDFAADLADAERLLALGMHSTTLRNLVYRRLASKYLCDTRQDLKDQIFQEIEEGLRKE